MRYYWSLAGGLLLLSSCVPRAEVPVAGWTMIAPDRRDSLDETLGAIGSGVTWDPVENGYVFVSDRGPSDGKVGYHPRFGSFRISAPQPNGQFAVELGKSTLLRTTDGKAMSGLIPNRPDGSDPENTGEGWCIDPEAIAAGTGASLYVSDEYGPFLYQFGRDGIMQRILRPPAHYTPRVQAGTVDFSNNDSIWSGRVPNRGFEGMTLTPDGKHAVLILQSGLAQDGGKDSPYTRLLVLELETGQPRHEYAYRFDDVSAINRREGLAKKNQLKTNDLSVSEIAALSEHEFLVLERDNRGADGSDKPKEVASKTVQLIDVRGATDLLALPGQPYSQPKGKKGFKALDSSAPIVPVKKTLFVDLRSAARAAPGFPANQLAAKWEGIAISPEKEGGRTMLVACDNDFMNPQLFLRGKTVAFANAKRPLSTQMFLFDLPSPVAKE